MRQFLVSVPVRLQGTSLLLIQLHLSPLSCHWVYDGMTKCGRLSDLEAFWVIAGRQIEI